MVRFTAEFLNLSSECPFSKSYHKLADQDRRSLTILCYESSLATSIKLEAGLGFLFDGNLDRERGCDLSSTECRRIKRYWWDPE